MKLPAAILGAGLPLALAVASPAAACDAGAHRRAVHPAGGGPAPLVVGDSVLLGAAGPVSRAGFEVDARGCRTMEQGLAVLRSRRRAHRLPGLVVLALGTNASVTRSDVRRALATLGRDRVLVLVTPRELRGRTEADARVVRAAARRSPSRVRVLDWVAYSRGHAGWFAADGIHLTSDGARAMARLLRRVRTLRVRVSWSGRPVAARRR